MDKVWIIIEYDYKNGGYETAAYKDLFFTSEEAAKEYIKTIPFNYSYDVKELNLYSEYLT